MGNLRDRRASMSEAEKFQSVLRGSDSAGLAERAATFGAIQSVTSASFTRGGAIADLLNKPSIGSGEIIVYPEADFMFGAHFDKGRSGVSAPSTTFNPADVLGAISVPSEILVDGTISGTEVDFYSITLVAGQTYMFSAYGSGATPLQDTILFLVDPSFNFISGGYASFPQLADDDGGAGTNSLFTFTATVTGTYFVGVGAFPGAGTGQYTLDAVQQPPTDVVGDTFADAAPITLGATQYGFIEAGPGTVYGPGFSEVDTFTFTAEAGMLYSFEIAGGADYNSLFFDLPPGELDTVIAIYDSLGNLVALNDDINFPGDISSGITFFAEQAGTYFIDIFAYQPWSGGYSITSQELNPLDFDPLDSIVWASASNVPFDATNTAYVYFARPGENFGESDDGVTPLPSLGWNDYEIQQVMMALEEYEAILGVNYVITNDVNQATFRLITTESELYGAYMYPQDPAFGTQQGIAVFNTLSGGWAFDQQQSLARGGFAFAVILHEFGHGHGLAHPHDNGGGSEVMLGVTGPFDSLGIYNLNQGVYTVMSYNDAWQLHPDGPSPFTADGIDQGWSGSLSAFDIAALQRRYGVINPHATGNTVYRLQDANTQGTFYQTIWDTGGIDVIRYDGARDTQIDLLAATIDYRPTGGGVVSFVDGIWGGYTIAQGVLIENAFGGAGNDSLLGNAAANVLRGNAGDDILVGRGGCDTLNGGAGFDIASYIDANSGVRASLGAGRGYTGDAAGDCYEDIEGLQGSRFNDVLQGSNGGDHLDGLAGDDNLTGGNGGDTLLGGAGNDLLDGGNSSDILDGGAGNDTLLGGNSGDTLLGGAGNDSLSGGNSGDILNGGAGDDTLNGGNSGDTFVFAAGSGRDRIVDFHSDRIDLTAMSIVWLDLDSNGDGRLDDADAHIAVTSAGLSIDLGAADGGAGGIDVLTLTGVRVLNQDHFLFAGG